MAKLLLLSDMHLRLNSPAGRIDDFEKTVWEKWRYMLNVAVENRVDAILQAGDFFDKPDPSYYLLNQVFGSLKSTHIPVYSIQGQHDIYMRNQDVDRTAFGLLDYAGLLFDVGRTKPFEIENTMIYGCSYFDEMNDWGIKKNEFNILIVHKMIGNKPLYPGHEITDAGKFLRDNLLFNILLCGDYHYPFHIKSIDGRHIVNTGCMLRLTRDERDMNRIPHFYIVNTDENEWKQYNFPCESAEKVFSEKIIKNEVDKEGIYQFIEKLKSRNKVGIRYLDVLEEYYQTHDVNENIQNLIGGVLQ